MIFTDRRPYWHGTPDLSKENPNYSIYLSSSFSHALFYSRNYITRHWYPIYSFTFKKDLNIFYAGNKEDYDALFRVLLEKGLDVSKAEKILKILKNRHWILLGEKRRESIINIIKKLKYDGFFNWETDGTGDKNPSVCIFDRNNLQLGKKLEEDDILKYIESDSRLICDRELQKIDYIDGKYEQDEYPPLLSYKDIEEIENE